MYVSVYVCLGSCVTAGDLVPKIQCAFLCTIKRPARTKAGAELRGTLGACSVDPDNGTLTAQSEFEHLIKAEVANNTGHLRIGVKFFCRWCPFRHFQSPGRVQVHQMQYHTKEKRYTPSGTQQLAVASALYDNDIFANGHPSGNYLQRSATIMRTQVEEMLPNVNFIRKGLLKRACFAGGMKLINRDARDGRLPFRSITTQVFASRSFYNLAFQEMLLCKGFFRTMRAQMQAHLTRSGSELTGLLPNKTDWWMRVCEDMMSSAHTKGLEQRFIQRLQANGEMANVQFDATVKVMLNVKGQGSYRFSKKRKASQALPEEQALYRLGCMRGTTGAVRLVKPIRSEVQRMLWHGSRRR